MSDMSDLLFGVIMLVIFAVAVYGAHAFAQYLRQHGHGARLDALHDATVRAQARILRAIARSRPRPGSTPNEK